MKIMRWILLAFAALIFLLMPLLAFGGVETVRYWTIDRADPVVIRDGCRRGETFAMSIRFVDAGRAANISGGTVTFRRSSSGSNDLTLAGSIDDGTNGVARVTLNTSSGWEKPSYAFEVSVSSGTSMMVRAGGTLKISDNALQGSAPAVLAAGLADDMAVPLYKEIDRQAPVDWPIQSKRGETLAINLAYTDDGVPTDLSHAYTAYFRYRAVGTTNGYAIPCEFGDRTKGEILAIWTAANELPNNRYVWDVIVSGATSSNIRAYGSMSLSDSIGYVSPSNTPTPVYMLDMATVQLINVGSAPWLSSYEIDDVRRYIAGLEDGTANLNVSGLTIGGVDITTVMGSAITNLDVAGYGSILRTGPHTATITVTGDGGGSSGGGGIGSYTNTSINGINHTNSVALGDGSNITWRLRDGAWRPDSSGGGSVEMPQTWMGTGTLYWVVDGVQIGRVDSNGITMLQGSLQLQEDDLNCNVRIYDGSRTAPSLTPYGHPDSIGMYVRGYMGSWGFGFAHAGTDILTINAGGLSMLSTSAAVSGRFIGDLSSCSNYPEPRFTAFSTNMVYPGFTIQTNGTLTMQRAPFGFTGISLISSNSTASFLDLNQTTRVKVDGDDGKMTIRNAGGSITWEVDSADSFYTGVKTQFTRNAANTAMITNIITYKNGLVKTFIP